MIFLGLNAFRATALATCVILIQVAFMPDPLKVSLLRRQNLPAFTFKASEWPEIAQNTSAGAIAYFKSAPAFNTFGFTQDWGTIAPYQFDLDSRGAIPTTPYSMSCPASTTQYNDQGTCYWQCGSMTGRRVPQNLKCLRPSDIVECKSSRTVALTFDDGPSPSTRTLIQFLKANNIKATFFLVGANMVQYPAIVRELHEAGFELGVHTWSHQPLTKFSNEVVQAELMWTLKAFRDILGPNYIPRYFRPPYGDADDRIRAIAEKAGLKVVYWNLDSFDTTIGTATLNKVSSDFRSALTASTLASFPNGLVELHHDATAQSVDFFTQVAYPHLKSLGLSFSLLSDCTGQDAYQTGAKAPAGTTGGQAGSGSTDTSGNGGSTGNSGSGSGSESTGSTTVASKGNTPTPTVSLKPNDANSVKLSGLTLAVLSLFTVLFA
jgi:peptidoglycan/xylan/chitin deacetylase (PgdA/CDA1 family)